MAVGKGSPRVPFGRHPEPGFRMVAFLPLQVHSPQYETEGALTTAASLGGDRCQSALVQGMYGLNEHRREKPETVRNPAGSLAAVLKELFLRGEHFIQPCFDGLDSTQGLFAVNGLIRWRCHGMLLS